MSTVGGDPDRMRALAAGADARAAEVRRSARRLADAVSRWNSSTEARFRVHDSVSGPLNRLATTMAELDLWAGRVGAAFAEADQPGAPTAGLAVASLLHEAPGRRADRVVEDLLVALATDGGLTRSDLAGVEVDDLVAAGGRGQVPIDARDLLNRVAVERWADDQPAPGSTAYDTMSDGERQRLDNLRVLVGEQESGGRLGRLLARQPIRVLRFTPEDGPDGEPTLQLFRGDPDAVDDVTVWVPGTTHGVHTLDVQLDAAEALRKEAADTHHIDSRLGVVIDLYDAPDDILLGTSNAGRTAFGEHHAPDLVAAVADARAIAGDGNVLVVGHSYGSFAVGRGAARGLDADDVALVGSPGTGERTVDGFDLPGHAEVFVARAPKDPIDLPADLDEELWPGTTAVALGPDPADADFGAQVFEVNLPEHAPGDDEYADGHSAYLLPGSQSLLNLATIAVGGEPSVARAVDADDRLTEVDAVGPGLVDDWVARDRPEYYGGTDVTRAAP